MSGYIIPIFIFLLLLFVAKQKVNAYEAFVTGASKSIELCKTIFPFIVSILIAVALFRASGLMSLVLQAITPVFSLLGIPAEVSELVLLRPFSGSGSLAILEDILKTHGADSYVARCASSIMGSSETVFYVCAIYFSKTNVKKLLYAIPVSLLCSLVSAILACLFCRIL